MIVLAVDDDLEDFEFFSEAINEIDPKIVVLKAHNGHEALHTLENHLLLPDFIFLDINMPMMDGKTCLEQIKMNDRTKDIDVIMYSTTTNRSEISQYKDLGASFLVKPDRFAELVKALSYILGYSKERTDYLIVL